MLVTQMQFVIVIFVLMIALLVKWRKWHKLQFISRRFLPPFILRFSCSQDPWLTIHFGVCGTHEVHRVAVNIVLFLLNKISKLKQM